MPAQLTAHIYIYSVIFISNNLHLLSNIIKNFLQDHINKLIIDEKIINKINRAKNSYKVNIELIDEKD